MTGHLHSVVARNPAQLPLVVLLGLFANCWPRAWQRWGLVNQDEVKEAGNLRSFGGPRGHGEARKRRWTAR